MGRWMLRLSALEEALCSRCIFLRILPPASIETGGFILQMTTKELGS